MPRPFQELVGERERLASSPSVAIVVPRITSHWNHEDPERVLEAVAQAAQDDRTPPWVSSYIEFIQAGLLLRLGRIDEARTLYEELGFIQSWMVIGPFDNDNEAGFETEFPPEQSLRRAINLNETYEGKLHTVGWREYPSPAPITGRTSLYSVMEPSDASCAYLATSVESNRARQAALRFGFDGAIRIWVNGVEVFSDDHNRGAVPDRNAVGVQLRQGRNRVFVKSCNVAGGWDLYLRLTQPDGSPLSGLSVSSDRNAVRRAPLAGAQPFDVPSFWSYFWDQVGGEPEDGADSDQTEATEGSDDNGEEAEQTQQNATQAAIPAQAWIELARFLITFGGDDPSEHQARDAVERALQIEENVESLLLISRLHPDRNMRLASLRRALDIDPRRIDVILALAGEMTTGYHPEDALEYLERAEQIDPGNLYIALARADLLDTFGMTQTALSQIRPLVETNPRGHVLALYRTLVHSAGMSELEEEIDRRIFQTSQNSGVIRLSLANRHVERGEFQEALELLEQGLVYSPLSTTYRSLMATILEDTGQIEAALERRREAIEICPDNGRLHEALAHFLDRQGNEEQAVAAARRSLELRPENPWLEQWISIVSEEERYEEPYVEEPEVFLARRGGESGHDVRTLLDLTVKKVHQSGQSDEYRQIVYEAVTLQGARNLGSHQVAFTPHRQRLRLERARVYRSDGTTREAVGTSTRDLYDPTIRMYYDLRATTIAFGDLQAGDVVEIRYRISDVGDANELGDYFGEMTLLQTSYPRARVSYVLLAPASREFDFDEPEMRGLSHTVTENEGIVAHVFDVRNVPAISVEAGMPSFAEIAPLLRISTFQTWEELGQWYWTLVRDQLELDASQQRTAEQLVRGRRTDLEKVRAIHEHVVTSVRYVALEFGVHRFKPYRVSDIERRGFGDCKDQASLMIAMLEHVGVDAEIVLVRTRQLGRLDSSLPSLEVFNHAIVYVPSVDLYIDPTAERVAVGDLPAGDQGAMALRVDEDTVTLTETPMSEAQQQFRQVNLSIQLGNQGSGSGRIRVESMGWIAGMSRAALDDPANRVNYLERLLSRYMRNVRVSNVTTSDLTELDSDTHAEMDVEVQNFARVEGDSLSFAVSIAVPLAGVVSLPQRQHDLVLGPPTGWSEQIDVQIPAGMRATGLPDPVRIDSPLANFEIVVTQANANTIRIRSSLFFRTDRVTPAQYPLLRQLVEQVTAARTARVRLVAQ